MGTGTDLALTRRTSLGLEAADARVRELLAEQGFGVLTEIDVQATLKAKLDVDRPPYRILGACNPRLADQALGVEPEVGLLLPCNVVVREDQEGTVVQALDPGVMVQVLGRPELKAVSEEARRLLQTALDRLP